MFKIIKKALLISFFSCSFLFPMSQLSRMGLARTIGQSAGFRNCLPAKCPILFGFMHSATEQAVQTDTTDAIEMAEYESVNASLQTDVQNVETNNTIYQNSLTDNPELTVVHQDGETHCYLRLNSEGLPFNKNNAINQVRLNASLNDRSIPHDSLLEAYEEKFNDKILRQHAESNHHQNKMFGHWQADIQKAESITQIQSILSKGFAEVLPNVQKNISQYVQDHASLSNYDLENIKKECAKTCATDKKEWEDFLDQNPQIVAAIQRQEYDKLTDSDYIKAMHAIAKKSSIDFREGVINGINREMQQKEQSFKKSLEHATVQELEQKIIPELTKKEKMIHHAIDQKEHDRNQQKNRLKDIASKLEECHQRSFFTKVHRLFKGDEKLLLAEQKSIEAKIQNIRQELQPLKAELEEINTKLNKAQKVIDEKKQIELQELQFIQKNQAQELLNFHTQQTHSQYDSLDLSNQHGSDSIQNDRQEALSVTEEQDYQIHNHEYFLSSQAAAYLQNHHIDIPQEHQFKGSTLQQQLHKEYCSIIEQAAEKQAQLFYESDLLTQCVTCAGTAHSANTLGLIQAVVSLNNMGFVLLEAAHAVLHVGQRIAQNSAHVITYPEETLQAMSKAAFYALETMLLNFSPPLPYPARDERNAEIAATLKNLSNQFKELTGLQQIKAVTQVIAEWVMAKPLISATGTMMGVSPETVALTANLLKTKNNSGSTLNLESATCKAGQNVAKKCKILQCSEVIEQIKKVGGKISVSKVELLNNTKYWLNEICTKINTKIEPSLLEQYTKMTKIPGTNMSICMDLEHIVNVGYPLIEDASGSYYAIELKGGHLAGTMSKLAQEGLVEIKSCTEFAGGCIEYQVEDLITKTKFTHTEFPASWTIEKIAQETKLLVEQAITNGSLETKTIIEEMTSEGFKLKIITNSTPKLHECMPIENTLNKHIVTSHPYKGKS